MLGLKLRFCRPSKLHAIGVLGMNCRNHRYIQRYNPRHLYPRVDNKLLTKQFARRAGIAVPELLGLVQSQHDIAATLRTLSQLDRFVIKPCKGSGGRGIMVVTSRNGEKWVKSSGAEVDANGMHRHISNIISGLYSLGGQPDHAMIEDIINFTDAFEGFSYEGVPDVRVIIFKGYPVMAMTRLSTRQSDGKANLHQGAVGVGISLRTGRPLRAVQSNLPLTEHPDTGKGFADLIIPQWEELLLLATRCYEAVGLGYFGADVVLDQDKGPMLLELNARPGLAIQTANGYGLLPRLKLIEAIDDEFEQPTPQQRINYSREHFD